jgi:tetratricopeptide (TPR) repeat protein
MVFRVDERVECYYDDGWYAGVIHHLNKDGTFFVAFDDGDELPDASADEIRSPTTLGGGGSPERGSANVYNTAPSSSYKANDEERSYSDILAAFMPRNLEGFGGGSRDPEASAPANANRAVVLSNVEDFLLPGHDDRYLIRRNRVPDAKATPENRLAHVLTQAAMMDHIRTMQTLYRDADDELQLEQELRFDNPGAKIPTQVLVERLCEKRARALALIRVCRGDDSLATLRAHVDLANTYALRGLWPQVSTQMETCTKKLLSVSAARRAGFAQLSFEHFLSYSTAALVERVFRVLRTQAVQNGGQISASICETLLIECEDILRAGDNGASNHLPHTSDTTQKLRLQALDLVTLLKGFILSFPDGAHPSWGAVVNFLRDAQECPVFSKWGEAVQKVLLPQNTAAVGTAFQLADPLNKGVAHPRELAACLCRCPTTVRIPGTTSVVGLLRNMDIEVPLSIDRQTGSVDHVASRLARGGYQDGGGSSNKEIVYELPLAWDEVLALYVLKGETDPFELLHIQQLAMRGIYDMFTNNLSAAEGSMREAIVNVSKAGLDESTAACELYNSIAQLMIMKHRDWHAQKKTRCRQEAQRWLESPAAAPELEEEIASLVHTAEVQTATKVPGKDKAIRKATQALTREQAAARAKLVLLRARARHLARQEEDPTLPSVEAAFRYLNKSYDILTRVHGATHPALGAAALAVASVQNMVDALPGAEEWLRRAITIMEDVSPIPVRALSFAHIQLSQVLTRLDRREEALDVLARAAAFHTDRAREGILARALDRRGTAAPHQVPMAQSPSTSKAIAARYSSSEISQALPLARGNMLYEDIVLAIELSGRLSGLRLQVQGRRQAAEQAQATAELAESAFGWDSAEAIKARKELGMRCAAAGDWPRAVANFTKSLEGHEILYGKSDPKVIEVRGLLDKALEERVVDTSALHTSPPRTAAV